MIDRTFFSMAEGLIVRRTLIVELCCTKKKKKRKKTETEIIYNNEINLNLKWMTVIYHSIDVYILTPQK